MTEDEAPGCQGILEEVGIVDAIDACPSTRTNSPAACYSGS